VNDALLLCCCCCRRPLCRYFRCRSRLLLLLLLRLEHATMNTLDKKQNNKDTTTTSTIARYNVSPTTTQHNPKQPIHKHKHVRAKLQTSKANPPTTPSTPNTNSPTNNHALKTFRPSICPNIEFVLWGGSQWWQVHVRVYGWMNLQQRMQ
jgi:hypothetical protein